MEPTEGRLAAIGAAAAAVLRGTPYHRARAEDVAAAVELPGGGRRRGRSVVWLYGEMKSRRVLVGLAAFHAWENFRPAIPEPDGAPRTVVEARRSLVAALTNVIAFHRAESALMTQVGHGIGDISTTEKRGGVDAPAWPENGPWGRVANGAWHSRLVAYADFLAPVIGSAVRVVTVFPERDVERDARLLSDLAFRDEDLDTFVEELTEALPVVFARGRGRPVPELHVALSAGRHRTPRRDPTRSANDHRVRSRRCSGL